MHTVEKTKEYSVFSFLNGNRGIKKPHFNKLKKAIQENNYLHLHPIIVNKNYQVIDGQHRLECAKALDLDIYFIQCEEVPDDHIITCNTNQRTWECDNFIDFFAVQEKKPEYIQLREIMKLTRLKPKALLTLILGIVSPNILEFLKTGKFKFSSNDDYKVCIDLYLKFSSYVTDKRIKPASMFSNFNFTKAFRWLQKTNGFQEDVFFKKLDLRWFDLKPQRTSQEWYELLISIYNFKNHNRLEKDE